MSASDKKPLVPSSHITVKIKSQDDVCVYFRIKRDVEVRKMMQAYSDKVGKQISTFRFLFDGTRIKFNQTPNEIGLEEEDEIEAFVEQLGGFSFFRRH
ncbi:PREDICTED: putative small ubiquitin-related modifier 8 [Camelina sativa]|uniref:Small ubiquitin-related modifier 8 n=1 Tax=Camelina sativa TaxID=90675 RepID=A0ABM1QNU7_CAMSA|nr:PREDICTED: putative small ubiquitin-related modifier 8 [Camelina sativa]